MALPNKYPLRCLICEEQFELEMKQSEYNKKEHVCTNCGSPAVERDFSVKHGIQVYDQTRWTKGNFGGDDKK